MTWLTVAVVVAVLLALAVVRVVQRQPSRS
jgi:hypothetical protein